MSKEVLTYTGDRFIVGIPAHDLTDDEIAAIAAKRNTTPAALRKTLTESGLYSSGKVPAKED